MLSLVHLGGRDSAFMVEVICNIQSINNYNIGNNCIRLILTQLWRFDKLSYFFKRNRKNVLSYTILFFSLRTVSNNLFIRYEKEICTLIKLFLFSNNFLFQVFEGPCKSHECKLNEVCLPKAPLHNCIPLFAQYDENEKRKLN